MPTDDPTLACLDQFLKVAMPAAVRKLRSWQGLSPTQHSDLVADLSQEVAADFLAHRAAIEAMTVDQRHERWLRLVGRSHYRLRGREARCIDGSARVDELVVDEPIAATPPSLPASDAEFVEALLQRGVRLKNGRLNEYITARSIGLSKLQLRRRGQRLIAALQADRDVEFWRRRLAEALVGLAADVLRDRGLVVIHGEAARARPDPATRLRRVQRIRERLRFLPLSPALRRVLARYGNRCIDPLDPARALSAARDLEPHAPPVHLWRFELAVVQRDPQRAARALILARRCGGDPVAIVLARARLLELRGRLPAARALLLRARRRRDAPRLRTCLERIASLSARTG
jgi:hypothetical protein